MSDAPERIWIDSRGGNWSPRTGGTQTHEYRRADLTPTGKRIAELEAELRQIKLAADFLQEKIAHKATLAIMAEPTDAQEMAHPKVKALVEAASALHRLLASTVGTGRLTKSVEEAMGAMDRALRQIEAARRRESHQ